MSANADRISPLEGSHFWFVGRNQLLLELMNRHARVDPRTSIADVGCGTGQFAGMVAGSGCSVVAADLDLPAVLPDGPEFLRCDLSSLPFRDESVDVLFVRDVFEHVDHDEDAFAECHRVLSGNGVLLATVPAWPRLWSQRDVMAGHKRRYTRATLRTACAGAGLDVLEIRGYQMLALPVFAVSRRLARRTETQLRREERLGFGNHLFTIVTKCELALGRIPLLRPRTGSSLVLVARRHA